MTFGLFFRPDFEDILRTERQIGVKKPAALSFIQDLWSQDRRDSLNTLLGYTSRKYQLVVCLDQFWSRILDRIIE